MFYLKYNSFNLSVFLFQITGNSLIQETVKTQDSLTPEPPTLTPYEATDSRNGQTPLSMVYNMETLLIRN